jgi:hypothetical protein
MNRETRIKQLQQRLAITTSPVRQALARMIARYELMSDIEFDTHWAMCLNKAQKMISEQDNTDA